MEKDLLKVDKDYILARLIESLDDLLLSVELWNRGFTRNSAGKAFSSVKALFSALILKYEDKLIANANNKEWIKKKGHIVPTHSMRALASMLSDIGIDVEQLSNVALSLHEYQYNGFEPGFSHYSRKVDVGRDINYVISSVVEIIEKYFSTEKTEEVRELLRKVKEIRIILK